MQSKSGTAGTEADVVTFTGTIRDGWVEVLNVDGAGTICFTLDGSTPTVGGDDTFTVPAVVGGLKVDLDGERDGLTVTLISEATPKYVVAVS